MGLKHKTWYPQLQVNAKRAPLALTTLTNMKHSSREYRATRQCCPCGRSVCIFAKRPITHGCMPKTECQIFYLCMHNRAVIQQFRPLRRNKRLQKARGSEVTPAVLSIPLRLCVSALRRLPRTDTNRGPVSAVEQLLPYGCRVVWCCT